MLRNGQDDSQESDVFYDQDKLFVSFSSPMNGYAAIFLEDAETAVCALPYVEHDDGPFKVRKGVRYVFLNVDDNTYHISCGSEPEINFVHVVFSPRRFIDGDLVRSLPRGKFRRWLGQMQSYDEKMQVQTTMIRVRPARQ